ncbi:MAG: SEC-C domain-containing protein, partial [Novosphingobium sp.]|uniref:SEC-C domain-containing protein n=1 Tax=Novosphingobium sp. TaxID=1874826 RepID=UPI003C7A4738
ITNLLNDGSIASVFSVAFNDTSAEHATYIAGATTAVPPKVVSQLSDLFSRPLPRPSLIRKAVNVMQAAAGAPGSGRTIGDYCSSATIDRSVNTPIICTYHAPTGSRFAYGPNAVLPGICSEGPEIMSMTLLSGPSLRKNQRCWCGSGKKFKHCHLKKFGSAYLELPGFTAPMTWTVRIGFDDVRPSGTEFIVHGGFE